jgi:diaminopimelate epimerase
MKIPFTKMHGAGNDYVYVNGFALQIPDPAALARVVSLRRKGIGSDGLILVQPSSVAAVRMEMYNADGSRGEMCGNGIRCVGKYAWEHGLARENPLRVETDAGIKTLELEISNGKVRSVDVDMGKPILDPARIPVRFDAATVIDAPLEVGGEIHRVTCVSMGNPHCVLFVSDVDELDLAAVGPRFEHHERFPKRINTEFVQVLSPTEVRMRVWERGSGETLACGTGASAVCVAGVLAGRSQRKVTIHLLGGDLQLHWAEADNHVYMTGPAVEVFSGEWIEG